MKHLILAALVAASAVPAFATTASLSASDAAAIRGFAPNADLSNLTAAQVAALSSALYSSDRQSEAGQQIRAILNADGSSAASRADTSGVTYVPGQASRGADR